jgi:hypothetical protein
VPILARILKDRGIVTERQLQEAIQHQVLYGGRLGTSLYELGFITEERLTEALARAHGMPRAAFDPEEFEPETVALVPKALAAKHKVFPYKLKGKTLFLLMVNPDDHTAVAKIGYSLGYIIKPMVIPEFRMIQLLHDFYGVDERWRYTDTHLAKARRAAPPVSPETAAAAIDGAETRDQIVDGTVALCLGTFRRVIFFIVREPWVLGWTGGGEGMDRERAAALRIPIDGPSVFRTVVRDRTVFVGKLGVEEEDRRFLDALGKRSATNAALFPLAVRGRVVNLVYGDNGATGHVKPGLGELLLALQRVPRAYLRIIRRRVADTRKATNEPDHEPAERTSE